MRKINVKFELVAEVECQGCDDIFNLFDTNECTDDGKIYQALFDETVTSAWGSTKNFDVDVECPHCGEAVTVQNINY